MTNLHYILSKELYDILSEEAFMSEPRDDDDLSTLYRFALGNSREPLHRYVESMSLDEFIKLYRGVEIEQAENYID